MGRDLIITTPTSSGKSLSFNLGVFEYFIRKRETEPEAEDINLSALYLFPLNALAKDQLDKLELFNSKLPQRDRLRIVSIHGSLSCFHPLHSRTYPYPPLGGMPYGERLKCFAERPPHILVTNPDILHHQLYRGRTGERGWENWRVFLQRLRFVVLVGCLSPIFLNAPNKPM